MPERPIYCTPTDVVRKFDPTITQTDLQNNDFIGNEDVQQLRARIDAVCGKLEDTIGKAYRLGREGATDAPETYEYASVDNEGTGVREPLWATLRYRPVLPFDPSEGDRLEVRSGKNDWDDITSEYGDEFVLDNRTGQLKLYRYVINRIVWNVPDDRYVRACYRYGALGGSEHEGGQTTLDGSITDSATGVSVADAARLPAHGLVLIDNSEYARITGVDYQNDTLTLSRGEQVTDATAHDDGATVHYAPADVRDAVAGKVAQDPIVVEDFVSRLPETGEGLTDQAKIDQWQSEWEDLLASNTEVRKL